MPNTIEGTATVASAFLPFWDEAAPGYQCLVPCWPTDRQGDAVDCPEDTCLVGVLGEDGLFRSEGEVAFDPRLEMYVCPHCRG